MDVSVYRAWPGSAHAGVPRTHGGLFRAPDLALLVGIFKAVRSVLTRDTLDHASPRLERKVVSISRRIAEEAMEGGRGGANGAYKHQIKVMRGCLVYD